MNPGSQGNIKMAVMALRSTKWRSALTMLGIIIGVVSVVTVVGIGEGIKHQVNAQINQLGRDLITIRPGQLVQRSSSGVINGVNLFSGVNSSGSLSNQDVQTVSKTPGIAQTVPLGLVSGNVQSGNRTSNAPVIATSYDLPAILNQSMAGGSFFGPDVSDEPDVAIVGYQAAEALYHEHAAVGHSFSFMGQTFVVRGVFNQFDTNPLSFSTDFNDAIFIPYSTAQSLTQNNMQPFEILAKPTTPATTDTVVTDITANLLRRRGCHFAARGRRRYHGRDAGFGRRAHARNRHSQSARCHQSANPQSIFDGGYGFKFYGRDCRYPAGLPR
jgi:putative ABC transport system permease protein